MFKSYGLDSLPSANFLVTSWDLFAKINSLFIKHYQIKTVKHENINDWFSS